MIPLAKLTPKHFFIVGALVVATILAILFRRWAHLEANKSEKSSNVKSSDQNQSEGGNDDHQEKCKNKTCTSIRTYALEELKVATKNFKVQIGIGGTSIVYLAELEDGRLGAVKRVLDEKGGSQKMVLDEVSVLLRISHPNLVGLMGFCLEKGLLDPNLSGGVDEDQLRVVFDVANQALLPNSEARPDMREIVCKISSCMEPQLHPELPV
ncbi:OLC1v1030812C1 [Oldenlandia corymbosa var. corymbosa]|uniref:non-specific serine/threonine protein kinase n=1 Tax=Oldenlandia corymbosa var. corymbosa TaxID=529605 RepID=A0AAV1CGX9_OLDCO|nr:OLC1v1030812C1 [Oldenlandia corymbosa var. corymbosa]